MYFPLLPNIGLVHSWLPSLPMHIFLFSSLYRYKDYERYEHYEHLNVFFMPKVGNKYFQQPLHHCLTSLSDLSLGKQNKTFTFVGWKKAVSTNLKSFFLFTSMSKIEIILSLNPILFQLNTLVLGSKNKEIKYIWSNFPGIWLSEHHSLWASS